MYFNMNSLFFNLGKYWVTCIIFIGSIKDYECICFRPSKRDNRIANSTAASANSVCHFSKSEMPSVPNSQNSITSITNNPLASPIVMNTGLSNEPTITLDRIVTEYLMNQHALCKNPVVTCPTFDLFQ